MSIEITIGNRTFPSKIAAKRYYRDILNRYPVGAEITGDDARAVEALLQARPDKLAELGGRRVVRFRREEDPAHYRRSTCFMAELDDGTFLDIGYMKFIERL